jgi:PAS domain S-box-containing protein
MAMKLKTKLSIGLAFLFLVILLFGILGIVSINRLSSDAERVLKNNYESLLYSNNMLKALEAINTKKDAAQLFEENLKKQESNITEPGEMQATVELRKNFGELVANPKDSANYPEIRQSIIHIQDLNEAAILRKNAVVQQTADDAKVWLTIIFTVFTLAAFTFIFNLPGIISGPIQSLSDGISEIAHKNYAKRIFIKQGDEFGELANAFNNMAEKLDEYEHSNLAQVKFEKSRIETIINQMRDGIIGFDAKRNVLFVNKVAEHLLGLQEAALLGKYAPDVALKNDLMRTLLQDGPAEKLKIYADNKESYFIKDVFEVNNNERVIGQVIVLRNITPFHELNEAKTNFIATVSHELKTPIASIKMSAQLLTDERVGSLNTEQADLIKSIRDDSDRLLKITGELLNMAQVETGNIQLKLQPAAASVIIAQSVEAIQFQAQQRNISIKMDVQENIPAMYADMEKTSWVLINFLTNAVKYAPEHSTIRVSAHAKDKQVEIAVSDSGNGIDEKYLPKIFDRYFKVPGTLERSGTGLGLAISKEFIEAQGGTIWAESKMGEGSMFGFKLPSMPT